MSLRGMSLANDEAISFFEIATQPLCDCSQGQGFARPVSLMKKGSNRMIEEVRLPQISEGIETALVIRVLVAVGDSVKVEQSIAEMETEKATFELPSPVEGKVTAIVVKEGQEIEVGELVLKVDTVDK